jgi:hypothetical protein
MNILERLTQRCLELPPEKQVEVLDFVEFLVSRHGQTTWPFEKRQAAIAQTLGSLAQTQTSSDDFALRKQEEKTKEERRWKP